MKYAEAWEKLRDYVEECIAFGDEPGMEDVLKLIDILEEEYE